MSFLAARINPIQVMADGTVKQINPFSGTEVWTVPGRGNRPITTPAHDCSPLQQQDRHSFCAFCHDRISETPPEKSRLIAVDDSFTLHSGLSIEQQQRAPYEFRRVPNLFEIVTYDYWQANYQYEMDEHTRCWMNNYLNDPAGRAHALSIVKTKLIAAGRKNEAENASEEELLTFAEAFFAGGHDVIIARRHFSDHATNRSQLASCGTLSVEEHRGLIHFTIAAMDDLYQRNRYACYVAVFQNWLKPAGASFDHLHKQLVAIDERGYSAEHEIAKLRQNPNMYNEWAVDYAAKRNLIIAENDHAVCFAGFGHRYPTLEVFSTSATTQPWLMSKEEVDAMSDLLHACHAAAGPEVPCNEEWHHQPIDLDIPMPWRVMIKWRISTLAGFEGVTKVYLNTISPWQLRDRVVDALYRLRDSNTIAPTIRIATECAVERNSLKYNPLLTR
ncbi:DUF4921 family protein [Corynebacterium felinum]|uniref:Galactose-1-phosphate uridylyltransferase n=1 Tax=Corynebacterium felinum TaxID=131318 RepID=A0ABU2BBT7_9CORY|nr:DUF4921 family protein [Corynebacterium felinum]MDF5819804.1 DUF4921 family protein [Corynebacterium felinum]MDR7356055.1 galactose-1-phosphate uridylyltransferase [Corynebacterium felinum]WJY95390.1 hypothetical protein CFELI_08925 [Corynebacterium felinum]